MSEVSMQNLVTQMRIMEAKAQGADYVPSTNAGADFSNVLKQAVDNVNDLQMQSKDLKIAYETGDPSANLIDVMVASQKAGISFQAMMQVRNKMISAYQEIMSMSV